MSHYWKLFLFFTVLGFGFFIIKSQFNNKTPEEVIMHKEKIFSLTDDQLPDYFNEILHDSRVEDLSTLLKGVYRHVIYLDNKKIRIFVNNADIVRVPVSTTLLIDLIYKDGKFINAEFFRKAYTGL